jgi:hypothetical protein
MVLKENLECSPLGEPEWSRGKEPCSNNVYLHLISVKPSLSPLLKKLTFTHISRVVILSAAKNLNFTQALTGDSSLRGVYPEATQTLRFAQGDKCRRASFRMTKPL